MNSSQLAIVTNPQHNDPEYSGFPDYSSHKSQNDQYFMLESFKYP